MICKWCGAPVDVTRGKCSACGRELPPLSDCGGFYNIVPGAARPEAQPCVQQTHSEPQSSTEPVSPPPRQKKRPVLPLVTLAVLLLVGVLSVVLFLSLGSRLDALEQRIAANDSEIEQLRRSNASALEQLAGVNAQLAEVNDQLAATREALEKPALKLSETDIRFCMALSEDGSNVSCDLRDAGVLKYRSHGTEPRVVTCLLDEVQLWQVKLSETVSGKGFNRATSYCFHYDVDNERLGKYQSTQPAEFSWQYRSADGGEWTELDESSGVHIVSAPERSESTVTIDDPWLRSNLPDGAYELRCVLTRHSRDGGTLVLELVLAKTLD